LSSCVLKEGDKCKSAEQTLLGQKHWSSYER
jgi:hypothetical protein